MRDGVETNTTTTITYHLLSHPPLISVSPACTYTLHFLYVLSTALALGYRARKGETVGCRRW
ncbi:hypothetical protein SLEP1_g21670 [Rubroshorea leprosula]|uniref:Uncharacterized protein n=1 Tax=Rubroshorea leprosula TaxID=152421 RepID=A0AAV5J6R1_9ROSI|nr:hypothetical protein SLEP1_g21670 [Rubroshorea leprosula]